MIIDAIPITVMIASIMNNSNINQNPSDTTPVTIIAYAIKPNIAVPITRNNSVPISCIIQPNSPILLPSFNGDFISIFSILYDADTIFKYHCSHFIPMWYFECIT